MVCHVPADYSPVEPGPLFGADYLLAYYCSWQDWHFVYVTWLLLLLSALIWLLGHTAGNYLSPTLAKVCESLNLSYNVAGVTFLAFGNGAPDVFTQVTSFTAAVSGKNAEKPDSSVALIGVNTMLGSSMFVITMVVGTVAILSPCHVSSKIYLRDVSFYFTAVTTILIIGLMEKLTVSGGIFLFCVYFAYVAVVLIVAERDARLTATTDASAVPKRMGELRDGVVVRSLGNDLQTAFWHANSKGGPANSMPNAAATKADRADAPYTFLVLNDTDSDSDEDDDVEAGAKRADKAANKAVDDGTITLSGGLVGGSFEGEIEEDYVDVTMAEREKERRQTGVSYDSSSGVSSDEGVFGGKDYDTSVMQSPLTAGLLEADETVEFGSSDTTTSSDPVKAATPVDERFERYDEASEGEGVVDDEAQMPSRLRHAPSINEALYWQQRFLQHRIRKIQASDFWGLPLHQKILSALEFPANFFRDVTIPTLQQESWFRPYAVAHPVAIGCVCLWTFNDWYTSTVLYMLLFSGIAAAYVFLTTHKSKPPQNPTLCLLWVLTAFFMCIVWFYLLCGEVISILESLGSIMNIPSAYLGLTLLAWGNSVGDFFSISALANRGLGEMAIAGCYASPVFDMLVGLGLSTISATAKIYPEPFYITLDYSSYTSILFLYFTLLSSVLIISRRGWRLEKGFGYFLYGTYAVYTLVQLMQIV